jgi:hypothetical protein
MINRPTSPAGFAAAAFAFRMAASEGKYSWLAKA